MYKYHSEAKVNDRDEVNGLFMTISSVCLFIYGRYWMAGVDIYDGEAFVDFNSLLLHIQTESVILWV